MKSSDEGINWTNSNNGITGTPSYLFNSGSEIYCSGQQGMMYKSTDGGSNWSSLNWPYTPTNIQFFGKNAAALYCIASGAGIYTTSDDGATWTQLFNGSFTAGYCTSGLLLAGNYTTGCYRSTDNGSTWTQINNGLSQITNIRAFYSVNNKLFLGGNELYSSTNNGDLWNTCTSGTGGVYGIISSENNLYIATASQGMLCSTDGGNTWQQMNYGLPNFNTGRMVVYNSYLYMFRGDGLWKYPL